MLSDGARTARGKGVLGVDVFRDAQERAHSMRSRAFEVPQRVVSDMQDAGWGLTRLVERVLEMTWVWFDPADLATEAVEIDVARHAMAVEPFAAGVTGPRCVREDADAVAARFEHAQGRHAVAIRDDGVGQSRRASRDRLTDTVLIAIHPADACDPAVQHRGAASRGQHRPACSRRVDHPGRVRRR